MPRLTRYCKFIQEFQEGLDSYISRSHGNRPCRKLRFDISRALARTLYTGRAYRRDVPKGNLYRLLGKIDKQMAADSYKLQRAWYEKCVYGASKGTVASRWKVRRREIACMEEIWSELKFGLTEYRRLIRDGKTAWRFAVDELHEEITIRLEDRAIGDMLFLALEGYAVPKGKGTLFHRSIRHMPGLDPLQRREAPRSWQALLPLHPLKGRAYPGPGRGIRRPHRL